MQQSQMVTIEFHDGSKLKRMLNPRESFTYNRQTEMFAFQFEFSSISIPRESVKLVTQEELV